MTEEILAVKLRSILGEENFPSIEEEKQRQEEFHKAKMKRIAEEEKHRVYNIWLEDDPVPYCIDDVPGFRD